MFPGWVQSTPRCYAHSGLIEACRAPGDVALWLLTFNTPVLIYGYRGTPSDLQAGIVMIMSRFLARGLAMNLPRLGPSWVTRVSNSFKAWWRSLEGTSIDRKPVHYRGAVFRVPQAETLLRTSQVEEYSEMAMLTQERQSQLGRFN